MEEKNEGSISKLSENDTFNIIGKINIDDIKYLSINKYNMNDLQYHPSWSIIFNDIRIKNELNNVFNALNKLDSINILPEKKDMFNAFIYTEFPPKVVILGQDPYFNKGEANGLSFSVNDGIKIPPSLNNIYKELVNDIPYFKIPSSGNLTKWAKEGVLLLNSSLSVTLGKPNSHVDIWKKFTEHLITIICEKANNMVFILWGRNSKEKKSFISSSNCILESPHPSPLSASTGFFGCKHFSKCNQYLKSHGREEINW